MIELRRHAPTGRARRLAAAGGLRGLPQLYASPKRRFAADLYSADRAEARRGGGFRWFFSTILAAGVGTVAIAAVIFGSMDATEGKAGLLPAIQRSVTQAPSQRRPVALSDQGLPWATPKSDRLQTTAGAMVTRYIVQDSIRQQRGNRDYIYKKPYARVVIRLAAVPAQDADKIPRFDAMRLLSGGPQASSAEADRDTSQPEGGAVTVRQTDAGPAGLAADDKHEIDNQDALDIASRILAVTAGVEEASIRPGFMPDGAERARQDLGRVRFPVSMAEKLTANTTVIEKTSFESDDIADEPDYVRQKAKLNRGETLQGLLRRHGADAWLARSMWEAATAIQADPVTPDLDIELFLVPSLSQANKLEPARITVTAESGEHRLTIWRNASGDFVASLTPIDSGGPGAGRTQASSLYASFYYGALAQGIPPETIEQVLRTHATEVDFRRRARGSDTVELFFDMKDDDKAAEPHPGEMLASTVSVGGQTWRYYRYRSPEGLTDYYDDAGTNSRRFLMKRPVRSDLVKFNNGYGMRYHPLLRDLRMHTGIDYAGPIGTPILAAGSGVIEEARYKGNNGNYVRIRHANGYQTAYSHMSKFAPGSREGAKVSQGQVIGFLGGTGLATGPHLHYEVLVGNRFTDPLKLPDQRERKLGGKQMADFQRERMRIEDLMRRPPVRVAQMEK